MATIGDVGLQEPSTITKRLAAVEITRNSTVQSQEVMVLGSPNSTTTLALAEVTGAAPASTTMGLVTRPIGPITVAQSTAGDLNVTVANLSTTMTVRQSSAGDLNVTVAGYSTTVNVSSVSGVVRIAPPSTASAGEFLAVRLSDGSTWVAGGTDYTHNSTLTASTVAGPVAILRASAAVPTAVGSDDRFVVQWGTLHGAANMAMVTSSGASAMDSTEGALKVNVVAGAAAGSTLVTIRQSSFADLNALSRIADRDASTNVAAVLNAAPVSTTYGLVTRDLSTGPFAISSIAGVVTVSTGPALARLVNSSGDHATLSTGSPAVGQHALAVRQGMPALLSTRVVITSSNSTALYSLISSAAGLRHKAFAYSLTSTETTPSTLVFFSSASLDRWAIGFGSGSSGVTGANLSVSPPAWLFQTDAANALQCLIEKAASTQCIVSLSIAYFSEP